MCFIFYIFSNVFSQHCWRQNGILKRIFITTVLSCSFVNVHQGHLFIVWVCSHLVFSCASEHTHTHSRLLSASDFVFFFLNFFILLSYWNQYPVFFGFFFAPICPIHFFLFPYSLFADHPLVFSFHFIYSYSYLFDFFLLWLMCKGLASIKARSLPTLVGGVDVQTGN